jgi:hypothetical protein
MDRNYRRNGLGVLVNDEGMSYVGEWKGGNLSGEGLVFFPYGGFLFGDFVNNEMLGVGVMKIASTLIVGNFTKSKLHGNVWSFSMGLWR